jgi:ribosomal protein S12 methylthiotransferase
MKIFFVSLGCDKNLVDSEMMLGQLNKAGYEITDNEDEADAVVVNTCCFIGDAKQESINTLIEFGEMRKNGSIKALIAAGCLAQRYSDDIRESIPEVDGIIGTMSIDEIVPALDECLKGSRPDFLKPISGDMVYGKDRLMTTGGHYEFLKIAEGCNKFCTYCVIPQVRGTYRSVPMDVLLAEAKDLADRGVKELILVAQETTLYGVDLYGEKRLPKLLRALSEIPGIFTIRVQYMYPEELTDELIEEFKVNKKLCRYMDIPIQSASDRVLKRMGRKTNRAELSELIAKLRRELPDICLRTTLISGFPGETRKDFKETFDFVKEARFDRLGVFTYSREEGTPAAAMRGQVPEFIKKHRRNILMKLQRDIAYEKAYDDVGRVLTVMVEGAIPEEGAYVCRTYKDAPGVDGYLFLETDKELMTGDIVRVRVTGARQYDLTGVIDDESTEQTDNA